MVNLPKVKIIPAVALNFEYLKYSAKDGRVLKVFDMNVDKELVEVPWRPDPDNNWMFHMDQAPWNQIFAMVEVK